MICCDVGHSWNQPFGMNAHHEIVTSITPVESGASR
jgi:hypothetical protein